MIDIIVLPESPGIYIYRNSNGEIIYVGKAINLKKRVSQYFQRSDALGPKTQTLVSQINTIETKIVGSEIEALILESSYIKKYHPKYNSLLKDDRSYQYICITKDKLPRVYSVFQSQSDDNHHLYGPFPSGTSVRSLLNTLRHIFPYYGRKQHPKNPCLYCHLKMCPGPNPNPVVYHHNISKIKQILSGKFTLVQRQLKKDMQVASKSHHFESAIILRNQLDAIKYIVSGWSNLNNLFAQINLPEDRQSSAIAELETTLKPYLNINSINRIECFDISQMGKRHFVGAMTVWQNGHLDNSQYRKFKISNVIASEARQSRSKLEMTANDSYMIKEVVYRRLQHLEWGTPDLIIVDGGKPQLSAASSICTFPIIGLAKRLETIVIKNNKAGLPANWREINLPQNSNALLLLESLRNEAHRFANRYRKQLMETIT